MATPRASGLNSDVWVKRVNRLATLALYGGVLGAAAVSGRAYRRWSTDVNVLTAPRARVERFRTDYRSKRANALEMSGLIGALTVEIVTASGQAARRAVDDVTRRTDR